MALEHLNEVTEEELAEQGVVSAPNILNGTPTENKRMFDRLVAHLIAPKVNEVVRRANTLIDAEKVREEQETERIAQEEERKTAEEGRVEAELLRTAAEQARMTEEAKRCGAEEQRAAAEGQRDAAERAREEAEALRVSETAGVVARAASEAAQASAAADAAQGASTIAGEEADRAKDEADRASTAADRAEEATANAPIVGDNGNWHVWNAAEGRYVDIGIPATGDIGPQGPPGVMVDVAPGMFAMGVNEAGHLILAVNEGDAAPPLSIDPATGHLIYNITTNE